jgi:hypothetical protein
LDSRARVDSAYHPEFREIEDGEVVVGGQAMMARLQWGLIWIPEAPRRVMDMRLTTA